MDVAAHQFSGGSIDHPVPFQRGNPGEAGGGDDDVEMTPFARTGVALVLRAVIANLEQGRMQGGFERGAKPLGARGRIHVGSRVSAPRIRYRMTPKRNTSASGNAIHTLNVTQSDSLRVMATQMLAKPSST